MRSRPQQSPSRRIMRWAGYGAMTIAVSIGGALVAIPVGVRAMVGALELMVSGSVWVATSIGSGTNAWTIVITIAQALGLALATPRAVGVFAVLLLVGGLALYALKRLLDSEEEEDTP